MSDTLAERLGELGVRAPDVPRNLRLAVTPITRVAVRDATATGDGSWTIEGYAAVFEAETVLWDAWGMRVKEIISRGAFTGVLASSPLVHLNMGHDMNSSVAATDVAGIGGLELAEDFHGLRFHARVDPSDPDAMRMAAKMRRGVVKQASFAFTIGDEEIDQEQETADGTLEVRFRINTVSALYDVCACPQGAYPQTESHLRALVGASLGRTLDRVGHAHRAADAAGASSVADEGAAVSELDDWRAQKQRASARARAAASRLAYPVTGA